MNSRACLYVAAALFFQTLAACSPGADAGGTPADAPDNAAVPGDTRSRSDTPVTAETPAADEKLVVAFGDSLYAGYRLGANEGFAPQLEAALDAAGTPSRVVNAGVSGDTSAAGRQRLAFTLEGLPRKPDLVLVGLGGNDMLRGVDPAQTRGNLDAILAALQKRGIPAMLTGMLAAPNLGPEYRAAFEPIYADLSKTYNAPLYPFMLDGVLGRRALMLDDGLHPNARGVETIAARVAPQVEAALKQ